MVQNFFFKKGHHKSDRDFQELFKARSRKKIFESFSSYIDLVQKSKIINYWISWGRIMLECSFIRSSWDLYILSSKDILKKKTNMFRKSYCFVFWWKSQKTCRNKSGKRFCNWDHNHHSLKIIISNILYEIFLRSSKENLIKNKK